MRRTILTLTAGILLGLGIGATLPALGDEPISEDDSDYTLNDLLFARAEGTLWALQNIVVSLAVDTERSAIDIAQMNSRMSKLERRIKALEGAGADDKGQQAAD